MTMTSGRITVLGTALAVIAICTVLCAQPARAEEDPAHDELRALRAAVIEAINKGDIDGTIQYVHPEVVVTWQNNEVCRGRDGLLAFFNRMGKDSFKSYKVEPTPDDLTVLYGKDTGVSFGGSVGVYALLGKEFEFHNRWTATIVKEDGKWLLASYHVSLDALDNPILNTAKNILYAGAGGGLLVGLVIGILIGRRRKKTVA